MSPASIGHDHAGKPSAHYVVREHCPLLAGALAALYNMPHATPST